MSPRNDRKMSPHNRKNHGRIKFHQLIQKKSFFVGMSRTAVATHAISLAKKGSSKRSIEKNR